MVSQLPFLLSIPHSGTDVPEELKTSVHLNLYDILEDGDAFSFEIYNLKNNVKKIIHSTIARAIVDLNRNTEQLPPEFPDGIFKSHTCYNKPVYKNGEFPADILRKKILEKYYFSYHGKIQTEILYPSIKFAFDCHTMADFSPPVSQNPGWKRPLVCLSNHKGQTCETKHIETLRNIFIDILGCSEDEVKINTPFKGGYITQSYGMKPLPWIQIELNRILYLRSPWFNADDWTMDKKRLRELNKIIKKIFCRFAESI